MTTLTQSQALKLLRDAVDKYSSRETPENWYHLYRAFEDTAPDKVAPAVPDDMELQLAKLGEFAGQAGMGHLARKLDEAVELATEAINLMTRFHSHAEPDDTPDMNAVFAAEHFRNFVDDHARLMFKLAAFKRTHVDSAAPPGAGK